MKGGGHGITGAPAKGPARASQGQDAYHRAVNDRTCASQAAVRQDPVVVVPYDAAWPRLFEQQRGPIETALQPWLIGPVEHIGSTAVPGLPAKPIIDMLARITDYDAGPRIIEAMHTIGWTHAPEPHDRDDREWEFCYPSIAYRIHHLHVLEHRSKAWPALLAFRDHLRSHPADAAEYARIKRELAAAHRHDRPAYRTGKAPFIHELIDRITGS
jgi:GrpB-like predicted nucleotidyltransferase (UPF0157 family)